MGFALLYVTYNKRMAAPGIRTALRAVTSPFGVAVITTIIGSTLVFTLLFGAMNDETPESSTRSDVSVPISSAPSTTIDDSPLTMVSSSTSVPSQSELSTTVAVPAPTTTTVTRVSPGISTTTASTTPTATSITTPTTSTLPTTPAAAAPTTFTVTYDGNTPTTGAAPTDGTAYRSGQSVTVLGNSGSLAKSGYTFDGWCNARPAAGAPCSGMARPSSSTFTIVTNVNLYAVWVANTLTVTYDEQGGSSVTDGSTATGASIAASPGTPTRSGHTFNGWFAVSAGGSSITFPYLHGRTTDFVLYAQWTPSCELGGPCAVGDTGPGGGIVFYVDLAGFACGPIGVSATCTYLEAAPTSGTNAWTDSSYVWTFNSSVDIGANFAAIGSGYGNTERMVNADDPYTTFAGGRVRAYRGPNNLDDWHLPSSDELNELCKFARGQATGDTSVGCNSSGTLRDGFLSAVYYWSSTEADQFNAVGRSFNSGGQNNVGKNFGYRVRAIRAFGP